MKFSKKQFITVLHKIEAVSDVKGIRYLTDILNEITEEEFQTGNISPNKNTNNRQGQWTREKPISPDKNECSRWYWYWEFDQPQDWIIEVWPGRDLKMFDGWWWSTPIPHHQIPEEIDVNKRKFKRLSFGGEDPSIPIKPKNKRKKK